MYLPVSFVAFVEGADEPDVEVAGVDVKCQLNLLSSHKLTVITPQCEALQPESSSVKMDLSKGFIPER